MSDEKKLYYILSDGSDVSGITLELSGVMAFIENEDVDPETPKTYRLEQVWLTDAEFNNLPESEM